MSGSHQKLDSYKGDMYGTPKYSGLEYDYEVPENIVVASPGGTSSIHHHWTKGFDGRGNSSSDIYAGQGPQYISEQYGSMYQQGHTASEKYYPAPPDYEFWKNQTPNQLSNQVDLGYQDSYSIVGDSSMKLYQGDQDSLTTFRKGDGEYGVEYDKEYIKEGFELIKSSEESVEPEYSTKTALITFGSLLLLFIVLCFWTKTLDLFIIQALNKGNRPSWKMFGGLSIFFTALLAIGAWLKYK